MHVHHDEHEAFYVLEGELDVACGDERYRAPAGSFTFLPRGVAHTFRVVGDAPARLLTFGLPGGMEGFFRDAGRSADGPGLPPVAPVGHRAAQARERALQRGDHRAAPAALTP